MIFSCRPLKIHVVVKVQNQIVIHNIIIIITGTPVATSNSAIIYDPPVDIKMTHFTQHKLKRDQWFSPSFYTHNSGYCMCISVFANGFGYAENTHVSVYAHLKPGENDDNLQWPFRGSVDISLLDQRSAQHHINETIPFTDSDGDDITGRVVSGTMAKGGSGLHIIAHTDLQYNKLSGTEYLTNDTLQFRINQVATFSYRTVSKLPSWYISSSTSLAKFTMTDFSKHKAIGDRWYSSSFYTHPQGYKFCVTVTANGWGDGAGTHVSVGAYMRKGEHDDRLEFPFRGTFHIKILNWRQDNNHTEGIVSISNDNDRDRKCGGRNAPKIASNNTFLPHTSLYYDAANNTEYVNDNDCLLILIIKVDIHNN